MRRSSTKIIQFFILLVLVFPSLVVSECTCEDEEEDRDKDKALRYKIGAIVSILVASTIGVLIPVFGKFVPALSPDRGIFFLIKAFAAGVILATGFIHVLPEAFERLTSPCLSNHVWEDFPFTGFVAMCTAMGTLMVDAFATAYFKKLYAEKGKMEARGDDEERIEHEGHVHLHAHGTHGHSQGSNSLLLRQKVISQVLELGIIVHSVIIGISLGASQSPETIKPLFAALTFHQLFEGMGLGSSITQAQFNNKTIATMGLFFALTTPIGIAIGIGITNVYDENSQTALIVEGILDAASAGILVYMALVDFLAADFMSDRMQKHIRLLLGASISLLLGAGLMSLLAKWA
ncbi:zinc transporter 5-like [Prosopis cineraria]|uniref:zinc transporter 5-like n=1 Tax=Prosopis cineraria TaxID=364024 RepID=UPI00240F9214|nr:zinc transporter 5-like [Prosopis cineraria]